MPSQATILAHAGVVGVRVTEKILIKNSTVCGLDKSVNSPRRKNTYQGVIDEVATAPMPMCSS